MTTRNPTLAQLMAEVYRLRLMRGLEEHLHGCGFGRLAGVDEVGRGALAGPVVAAAVPVTPGPTIPGVDDSKHLRAEKRERLAALIEREHGAVVIAVSPAEIDRINILQATKLAMRRALDRLDPAPELALVDAVRLDGLPYPVLPVIRGDQISYAIACASIVAKVARDRLMIELEERYPHYGFASNKGYGAAVHRQALIEHGPSRVHRLTFRSVLPQHPEQRQARGRG